MDPNHILNYKSKVWYVTLARFFSSIPSFLSHHLHIYSHRTTMHCNAIGSIPSITESLDLQTSYPTALERLCHHHSSIYLSLQPLQLFAYRSSLPSKNKNDDNDTTTLNPTTSTSCTTTPFRLLEFIATTIPIVEKLELCNERIGGDASVRNMSRIFSPCLHIYIILGKKWSRRQVWWRGNREWCNEYAWLLKYNN